MNQSNSFAHILPSFLQQAVEEMGFTQLTAIQQQVIPVVLQGKDIAAQAETGSGKTAAYGLALLQQVKIPLMQVQVLVIVPTRELVMQVQKELKSLGKYITGLKVGAIYGGHSFREELNSFKQAPQFLIATPGRLLDHLQRNSFDPQYITGIVMDEADKLLELGFEEQLNQIITYLPTSRQNLLFSATFPPAVVQLTEAVLKNPVSIRTNAAANPDQIEFKAFRITADAKPSLLLRLLSSLKQERIVIFCNTRERVDEVADLLKRQEFPVAGLHGAMDQLTRDQVMTKFRNGSISYLVATDLAARGLHIEELNVVIHLEILREEASFLHRSGRTGRAGKSGIVYLFLSETEEKYLQKWQQVKDIQWLKQDSLSKRNSTPATTADFITIHLKAGKKEKMSAGDIVGALLAKTGLQANQIGKIEIFDHFSYVAVPYESGKKIVDILNQVKIKGNKIRASLVK